VITLGIWPTECLDHAAVIGTENEMIRRLRNRKIFGWMLLKLAIVLALRLFVVREMIAALIIFSVLFACVVGVLLLALATSYAIETARIWISARVSVLSAAGWRVERADVIAANQLEGFQRAASPK